MLADILTEIFRDVFIGAVVSVKNKTVLFGFSLLIVAASTGCLLYVHSLPLITVEDYYSTEISFSRFYFENAKSAPAIVLVSNEQNYTVSYRFWRDIYSPETVIDKLSNHQRARVWLSSSDSHEIKGIVTSDFSIEPAVGVAWENKDRNVWSVFCWIFFGLGGLLILTLILLIYIEQKPKRNWWI